MKNSRRFVLAVAACAMAAGVLAGSASAYDAYPCAKPVLHKVPLPGWGPQRVQYCPLWRENVPVYASPTSHSRVVGYLRQGGSVNWFFDQMCVGAAWYNPVLHVTDYPLRLGSYISGWWANTLSDRPYRLGYVNEVYFRGGSNWQADRGLRKAGPVGPSRYCLW